MDRGTLRRPLSLDLASPKYITPPGMHRAEFRAMGTTISLLLPVEQSEQGVAIVRTLFAAWEQTLSRFLPESELSQLNQHAGTWVAVSDLLFKVLTTALTAARATQGCYDPALLEQLELSGYDRTFEELPAVSAGRVFAGKPGGAWRDIQVDEQGRRVILPPGVRLDFGGIAKGMAVDAAIEKLRLSGIYPALVNAGGDLAVEGLPPSMEHWQIAVPGGEREWMVPLRRGAVATSGITRRHWWQGSTHRHHLLDPRTGLPAQSGLWSVTVTADRCEQAEVAAKVAFILGAQEGSGFLRKHQIAGLLVYEDGTWEGVEPWPVYLMEVAS
ncbi:MAG TPA: FAD:protein FMN transferase [Ktedonobacteraceae bacterium]|nr:FAD:protein FMN transferase [Ktedonobacteraceae bacterium]